MIKIKREVHAIRFGYSKKLLYTFLIAVLFFLVIVSIAPTQDNFFRKIFPKTPSLAANLVTTTPATLADYWQGKAKWQLTKTMFQGQPIGYGAGMQMYVVGNTWYLFHRYVPAGPVPSYCNVKQGVYEGVEVQKSTDQGSTWSDPVPIIIPQPNTAWECVAMDGGAYFNTTENKWHYLFQCLSRNSG